MRNRISRFMMLALVVAVMPLCMGTSCGRDVRDALQGVAIDFVAGAADTTLNTAFPLSDIIVAALEATGRSDQPAEQ